MERLKVQSTLMKQSSSEQGIALILIAIAILLRWMPHPPNLTPIAAIALLAGATLSPALALSVPLAAMIASDLLIGPHALYPLTWACFYLTTLLGMGLGGRFRALRIAGMALTSSVLFYVVTNLGVFLTQSMYEKSLSGLLQCYAMALPFFRNQLLGDLFYTAVFFGAFFLALRRASLRSV